MIDLLFIRLRSLGTNLLFILFIHSDRTNLANISIESGLINSIIFQSRNGTVSNNY